MRLDFKIIYLIILEFQNAKIVIKIANEVFKLEIVAMRGTVWRNIEYLLYKYMGNVLSVQQKQ